MPSPDLTRTGAPTTSPRHDTGAGRAPVSRIPNALLAEVKARTDLVALAHRTTALRRAGNRFVGLCPFHEERTPSFHVVPARGFYHCFGCGAHGSAIDFVMQANGVGFAEAVMRLAQASGLTSVPPEPPAPSGRERPRQQGDPGDPSRRTERERRKAFRLWLDSKPLKGSVAEAYLVETRGLSWAWARRCPVLGFAPRLGYWSTIGDRLERIWDGPALLAAMQDRDGRFAALHITYLQPDGNGKLALFERPGILRPAKKVRGSPAGAAIRLTPAAARMAIGEGIETTASVFGEIPHGWAAYALDNLAGAGLGFGPRDPRDQRRRLPSEIPDMARPGLLPPPECRHVTYLGDGDTKDLPMLEQKLRRAVRRALQLGLTADYAVTPQGTDFNDLVRMQGA